MNFNPCVLESNESDDLDIDCSYIINISSMSIELID